MDQHCLTSLFEPKSVVVFAGNPDAGDAGDAYAGQVTWLDVATTGTLADLTASRADLALAALPAEQTAAALEVVGRIRCRAALGLNASTLGTRAAAELAQMVGDALSPTAKPVPGCWMGEAVALAQPGARINGVTIQPMAGQPHPGRRRAKGREVCVGLTTDEPFGPVITFGAGGTMIELINDRALELPPLEQVLLRVSEMVCALPQLREMDINPLIVGEDGVVADDLAGQGLGARLMLEIVELVRAKGLARIMGLILAHNAPMLRLMGRLGFTMSSFPEDPDFKLATKLL